MKLGAIPSLIVLILMLHLAIPSEANLVFRFMDSVSAGYCPDVGGYCDIIPTLKLMTNIIAGIGFIVTLLSIIGQLFRGEFFSAKEKQKH